MKPRQAAGLLLLGLAQGAGAEPPQATRMEVDFLLGFVDGSGCAFFRNGTWYDAHAAQAHLRDKYDYLAARDQIHSGEDFIDRAASQSSFSGQPYAVRCVGGATIRSSQWLREELARLRGYK
jgi:hypothetical protein